MSMDYEEKIRELTERVEKLEKAEHKRVVKRRIEIISKIIIIIVVLALLYMAYVYVNNNYIKPYKEKIDSASEKIEKVENYINDKFSGFKSYFSKD